MRPLPASVVVVSIDIEHRPYLAKPRITYYPGEQSGRVRPQYTREIFVVCPFCASENHYRERANTPLVQRRRCHWCRVEHQPSGAYRINIDTGGHHHA